MTPRETFEHTYGDSPNFMTPTVMEYGATRDHVWEMSWGEGILGGNLFGVTILTLTGDRTALSKSFGDEDRARTYINLLEWLEGVT